jgi:hypothetical protein
MVRLWKTLAAASFALALLGCEEPKVECNDYPNSCFEMVATKLFTPAWVQSQTVTSELMGLAYDPVSDSLFYSQGIAPGDNLIHRYKFSTGEISTVFAYPSQWDYGMRIGGGDLFVTRSYDRTVLHLTGLGNSSLTQVANYHQSAMNVQLYDVCDFTKVGNDFYFVLGNFTVAAKHSGIQTFYGPTFNSFGELLSSASSGWPVPAATGFSRSIVSVGSGASLRIATMTGLGGRLELRDGTGALIRQESGFEGTEYLQTDSSGRIYTLWGEQGDATLSRWDSELQQREDFPVAFSAYGGETRFVLREVGSQIEVIMVKYRTNDPIFYKTTISQ